MRWTGGSLRADLQGLDVGRGVPTPPKLLLWVYLGRVLVAVVVFLAAAFYVQAVSSGTILTVSLAALAAVGMSGASVWYTHVRRGQPTLSFLYAQVLFDLVLVTTVVHVTGGAESDLSSLYIPVIAVSSVLMPLRSGLLITVLAGLMYMGDVFWGQPVQPGVAVWLQIGVFALVALITGWIASRVRVVKDEHEVLQQEVQRLSLEASDILHNIGSGVVTVDGTGDLLYANPAAESLLGFAAADLEGRPAGAVLSGRSPALWDAITATQRGRHGTLRAEGIVRLPGRSFPIGLTTTALSGGADAPEASPTVTAIFRDISDQKRLEELHLRTQRLEAVAELSASLAHEIRNPLASIRTSVEQLSKSVHTGEDERFLAQLVVRESDRLSRILSEFLDFSRVRVTRYRPVDLGEVAAAAIEVVRGNPACTPETAIAVDGSGVEIEGDEDLLHRVVVNLVLNAVQAADGSCRIRVEIRHAAPSDIPRGAPLDNPVLLRVTDDGPGIPGELRPRLFDPFVTGRVGGTGLGLAIVQRAVQAHRGLVLVDSHPDRGTVFTVLFPAKRAAEVAA